VIKKSGLLNFPTSHAQVYRAIPSWLLTLVNIRQARHRAARLRRSEARPQKSLLDTVNRMRVRQKGAATVLR
jgi:hypothetical protein